MRERPLAVGGALRLRLEAKRPKAQSKLGLKAGKIEGEKMGRWEAKKLKVENPPFSGGLKAEMIIFNH